MYSFSELQNGLGKIVERYNAEVSIDYKKLKAVDTKGAFDQLESILIKMHDVVDELYSLKSGEGDLVELIPDCLAQFDQQGLRVTFHHYCDVLYLSDAKNKHCLSVLGEACANAIKHGKSTTIAVILMTNEGRATISVSDLGSGMKTQGSEGGGVGMLSMKKRAAALHGEVAVLNNNRGGMTVQLDFPCSEYTEQHNEAKHVQGKVVSLGQLLHDEYCQLLTAALVSIALLMESLPDEESDLWAVASSLETSIKRKLVKVRSISHALIDYQTGDDLLMDVS